MTAGSVLTQLQRLMVLDTPLAPDVLLISSFTASETMSNLFHYEIDMVAELSKAPGVKAKNLIGEKCTVHLSLNSDYLTGPRRHFNGIVSSFTQGYADRRFVHYRAEVVPWLWLMTLSHDCRIFQDLSTLEIVKLLFDELKGQYSDLVAYRDGTTKTYTKLDYCVQYRESGFNFISRLLEQDGIFYFFEHEKDKHTLVLADAPSIHKPCPNQATATYLPEGGWGEFDSPVTSWEINNELRPGKYMLRDFHMQMPSKTLEVLEPTKFDVGNNGNLEVYDYPGEYARRFNKKERQGEVESEATKLVKMRMEEEETPYEQIRAASLCRGFTPGFNFKLNGHFDRGVNAKYVLTSIQHVAVQSPWYVAEETDKQTDEPYRNTFTAIPDDVPFRPARKTRKPVVPGTQTAIVVGPSGEEIWTDEFSRIKVQFHWDRKGKKDAKSSCWIRVATNWAGKQWGMIIVPRIGQEVIVDFLEGDPDQPIIIGSVYNADMMPPYTLPDNGTQSGIKTRSSKNGTTSNFNEIRFQDKKDSEELYIHAEKNKVVVVEHNRTESVGNDESISIGHDRTESVDNNETINITANRTETVGKNETINIGENRALTVEKNEDITINQNETIEIGKNREESVGHDSTINVGKNFTLNAGDSITLTTGSAELNMQKDGTITLVGKNITIQGSGAITVKASQTITMKGSKVLQN